jgi:2-C-methyl-D-erythritol 4-phosphate cytidylyltransferase
MYDEEPRPLGVVPLDGRGALPFALVHGESLVASASWALGEAEVDLVDFNVDWDLVRTGDRPLVVHDPLCPLTPPAFIASAVALSAATDAVVFGEQDGSVASPVVLPASVLVLLTRAPDLTDLGAFVDALRARPGVVVRPLAAPSAARRVTEESGIAELEALAAEAQDLPAEPRYGEPRA